MAELTAKLEAAAAADPAWFVEFVAASAGEPFPFHPKLGLTEDECAEFLSGVAEADPGIVDQATVRTVRLADNRYELSGSTATGDLTGVIFDARTMVF